VVAPRSAKVENASRDEEPVQVKRHSAKSGSETGIDFTDSAQPA
jgi:hypothetical protein